jgi:hypothetical protein
MRSFLLLSVAVLAACDGPAAQVDGGGTSDVGAMSDAGSAADVGPGPTDAGTGDAGPSDAGTVTPPPVPYYEVPTTDGALASHVFFAVPDVHYVTTAGIVTLTYDFPPDLSGVIDQPLTFTGPVDAAGNATITGAAGTGTCTATGDIVRCTEHFSSGLLLDTASARAMASGYSTDPAARAARGSVIDLFASDPIGIVVFDRIVASEPSGGAR